MTSNPKRLDELLDRIDRFCDGDSSQDDLARLEELASSDEELCWAYICYSHLCAGLRWTPPPDSVLPSEHPMADEHDDLEMAARNIPPPISVTSSLLNAASSYVSSGWPVAYFVAAVVLGIGALIGAFTYVSQPASLARVSHPTANDRNLSAIETRPIGRITGIVDCKWAKGSTFKAQGPRSGQIHTGSPTAIGDRFQLVSGLLEISYNSGARVLLQGPVTYEVDSANGGYLSMGKLTARVETGQEKVASGQWPVVGERPGASDIHHSSFTIHPSPSLPTIHHPLFTIQTPTAAVTDIGTEFGVEVDKEGVTTSHVFRGIVEVQGISPQGKLNGSAVRLVENETVRVEKTSQGEKPAIVVQREKPTESAFVAFDRLQKASKEKDLAPLRRWQAHSRIVRDDPAMLAYYTFETRGGDSWILQNAATTGSALDAQIEGPLWTFGRFPGKSALRFRGPGTPDRVVLPEQQRFNFTTPFSIAVWFKAAPFHAGSIPSLISKSTAWRLQRFANDTNALTIDTAIHSIDGNNYDLSPLPRTVVTDGRWHLAVVVIEPGETSHRKRLYIDGRLEGQVEIPVPLAKNDDPVWIGQSSMISDREFDGLIDEVAILARTLSEQEIKAMYDAGNPANTSSGEANHDR